ncbi:hypothetical protein KKA39_01890 [Patescibacteria group bacterium]|nr:hypothetical protein [Patescibacteria group bacterium]MBU1728035.1 hypothetical protein [Patescibacteria group bacterium]
MSLDEKEKLNKLEELKSKLFSKTYKMRDVMHGGFSHQKKPEIPDSWDKKGRFESDIGEKFFMKTSVFKKFFIFSIIFFVFASVFAFYMFFFKGNTVSNNNIDISIIGNAFTAGGEELPLQIEITNRNNSPLELADLLIEYPKGSSGDLSQDAERFRSSLGTIPAGSVRNENVKIVVFGEQGSVRPIRVSLEYRVEGSNAIFVKEKPYEVSISSAPINLLVDAPNEASPNQEISFNVKATLNATKAASKILLKLDYPVGFQFESAKPSPSFGDNVWNLGDLAPGTEREISIIGKMIDVSDGEEKTFHVFSGSQSDSDKSAIGVVFNSMVHTLAIKRPFIEAKLFVNGIYQREYATDSKTSIQGEVRWANNLETKINDLEIRAKISGNAMDRRSISATGGFYNSLIDTIVWDKNSQPGLAEVNPGDSGSVSFLLSSLPLFSAGGGMLSDPSININVSIIGKQPLEGNASRNLDNSESKIIRIISDVGLAAKGLYYSGAFTNTGPIPPKVEQETTYTIVWGLSNTSNNISKAKIISTLPPWVNFVGPISPSSEDLSYNASTKEIVWNIGGIPRGTGISEVNREVSFQVSLTPSLSQVGTLPVIINDAVLTGHDDFANVDIRVNKTSLNTRLSNDSLFPSDGDRVVE